MPNGRLYWNNVAGPDFSSANQMFDRAAIMQNNAAKMINQAFDDYTKAQQQRADNLVAGRMAAVQDLNAYQDALASGDFLKGTNGYVSSQMLNNLQNGVGTRLANAANLESLEQSRENREWQNQARDTLIAASPYLQEINALANSGRLAKASQRIASLEKMANDNGWRYDVIAQYIPNVGKLQSEEQLRAAQTASARMAGIKAAREYEDILAEDEAFRFRNDVVNYKYNFDPERTRTHFDRRYQTLSPRAKIILSTKTDFNNLFGDWSTNALPRGYATPDAGRDASEVVVGNASVHQANKELIDKTLGDVTKQFDDQINYLESVRKPLSDYDFQNRLGGNINRGVTTRLKDLTRQIDDLKAQRDRTTNLLQSRSQREGTQANQLYQLQNASMSQTSNILNDIERRMDSAIEQSVSGMGVNLAKIVKDTERDNSGNLSIQGYAGTVLKHIGLKDDPVNQSKIARAIDDVSRKYNLPMSKAAAAVEHNIQVDKSIIDKLRDDPSYTIDIKDLTQSQLNELNRADSALASAASRRTQLAEVRKLEEAAKSAQTRVEEKIKTYMSRFGMSEAEARREIAPDISRANAATQQLKAAIAQTYMNANPATYN